jgi:hypothetical protein
MVVFDVLEGEALEVCLAIKCTFMTSLYVLTLFLCSKISFINELRNVFFNTEL